VANSNAGSLLDVLTLPDFRGWRIFLGLLILALALLGPPACTFARLVSSESVNQAPMEALAGPIDFTRTEQATVEPWVDSLLLHSCAFPIWIAPGSSRELFGLSTSLAERSILDQAISLVTALKSQTRDCVLPSTQSVLTDVDRAMEALGSVSREQGKDRGVVLFHRALLLTWTEQYGAALEELAKLDERVRESGVSLRSRSTVSTRARGLLVATRYLRGYVMLKLSQQQGESPDAAIEEFRGAIEAAEALFADGPTAAGPFVTLQADRHLVELSTAPIWNDLIKGLSLKQGGVSLALQESEALRQSPSFLRQDLTLAANLLLLTAADPSGLSLSDRQDRSRAIRQAFDRDTGAAAAAARQRASIAFVVLGLEGLEQNSAREDASAVRRAFTNIFSSGAATGSLFSPLNVQSIPGFKTALDQWLFVREWRRLLEAGDVQALQSSYTSLSNRGDVDMTFFAAWREEALAQVEARSREPGVPEAVRQQMCAINVAASGGGWLTAPDEMMRCTYGSRFLLYVLLWGVLVLAALAALALFGLYRRTFAPYHYIARRKAPTTASVGPG